MTDTTWDARLTNALLVAALIFGMLSSRVLGDRRPQNQDSRSTLLELARSGQGAEAWQQWEKSPPGDSKNRLGIELAVETGQIQRAVGFYGALSRNGQQADLAMLRLLALGAATELASSRDLAVRATACGAALAVNPAHTACRAVLEKTALSGQTSEEIATAYYTLANAGLDPFPQIATTAQTGLTKELRLKFSQTFTRLPSKERLWLIDPLLRSTDVATQYQALLIAADIPGEETLAVLRSIQPQGPARIGLLVALARHGDATGLAQAAELLENLGGYEKIQISRALAASGSPRGVDELNRMLSSPMDFDRVTAANVLAQTNPEAARKVIVAALSSGGPAIQPAALRAAGLAMMGTHPAVYRRLAGTDSAGSGRSPLKRCLTTLLAGSAQAGAAPR